MPIRWAVTARHTAMLAATAVLVTTACSGTDDGGEPERKPGPGADSGGPLNWSSCSAPTVKQLHVRQEPQAMPDGTTWECSTLKVPRDHDDPKGETIDLELIRVQATEKALKSDKRRGSLVFNFGGPGSSGVASLPMTAKENYESLRAGYDLVSFDPRGVGESSGVACLSDKETDKANAADGTPDTAREEKAALSSHKRFVTGCTDRSGELLKHLTTENTARDMDLLREALGEKRLNYFGISYGTKLGGVYARLFPDRVGRMVLDAPVDTTQDAVDASRSQAEGFQLALDNYLDNCARSGDSCPMGDDPEEGTEKLRSLLKKLDSKPLPAQGGRQLTESLATTAVVASLYEQESWQYLTAGLQEALSGRGDTLLALADSYAGRDREGRYSNIHAAGSAINCADSAYRPSVSDVKKHIKDFEKASPVFGPTQAWGLLGCTGWPTESSGDTADIETDSDAPILVLGNKGDPATPYRGARKMTDALGGAGRLLTFDGEGHGAYDKGGSCVRSAVDGYLLKGKAPEDGKTCS